MANWKSNNSDSNSPNAISETSGWALQDHKCLHPLGQAVQQEFFFWLMIKVLQFFEKSDTTCPTTKCDIPEDFGSSSTPLWQLKYLCQVMSTTLTCHNPCLSVKSQRGSLPLLSTFLLRASRTDSLIWTITFRILRKKAWLEVLLVRVAMDGNCRSQPDLTLVGAVTITLSFVNLEPQSRMHCNMTVSRTVYHMCM